MNNKARKWRSVIASVLVICMMFSIFPTAAFAQDANNYNCEYSEELNAALTKAMVEYENAKQIVIEEHPVWIANAWAYADNEGYTAKALTSLEELEAVLKDLDVTADADVDADVVAEVEDAIDDAIEAIDALEIILKDEARTPEQAMSVVNELCEAVADVVDALALLGQPYVEQAMEEIEAALEQAAADMEELAAVLQAELQNALEAKIAEAEEALIAALYDLHMETADEVYEYLYNNPGEVIDFFNEYGDDMLALMEEYGPYALAAMKWIADNYGDEVLDYVMDNQAEIIGVTAMLLEKHGENAAKLINVYAEYLGWCDEVRDVIDGIEDEIDNLNAQLDALKAQLEELNARTVKDLYEQLENASEEAKAQIEAAIEQIEALIDEVEAAIEQIEAAIEQLEAQLAAAKAELEKAIAAIEAVVEAIEEAVEAGVETVEEILAVIDAVVDYAEENIAGVKTAVDAIEEAVKDIIDFTEELIENGIIAAEKIEKLVDYITDVVNGVVAELEKGDIEAAIEEIRNQLTNGYEELNVMLDALDTVIADELAAIVADLDTALAKAQKEFEAALYDATHGTFACDAETIAVAGGDTVATEDGYADIVAAAWGLEKGNVEDADVILYQVDPQIFVSALLATVNGEYEAAWETYITDAEVLAYLEQAKAAAMNELAAEYGEDAVTLLEPLVDSLLFAAVDYAVENIEAIEGLKAINSDALIVAVGMYNPLQDLTVTINGEVIDVEELCQYVIEVTDVYNLLYAVVSQDVVFVDVCEADAQAVGNVDIDAALTLYAEATELFASLDMDNLDPAQVQELMNQIDALYAQAEALVMEYMDIFATLNTNYATAEGHAYMAEQILAAVTQADHELGEWAFDKANHWKECAICGESFDKDAHEYSGSKDKTCNVCGYERKVSSGGGGAALPVKPAVKGQDAFMSGYPDGTFGPDRQITRGEVAAMFARLMADKAVAGKVYTNDFTDVPASLWSANAIGFMQEMGVVKGYTDGTFRPEQPITRAEFVAMASRFEAATGTALVTFTDVPANHWAANVIKAAAAAGWVGGYEDGTFRPDNNITRAEATAVMCNVLDIEANVDYITANVASLKNFSDVTKAHWAYWDIMAAVNGNDCVK